MKKRFVALLLVLVLVLSCAAASGEVYYRLKKKANLMTYPDYDSKRIDSYRTDWVATIDLVVNKTWASITLTNGKTGYVERSKLVRASSSTAWVSKDKIKVRRGPGYTFSTLYTLNKGDKVTVLSSGASYSYIKTSSGTGYIESPALSKKKVAPGTSLIPAKKTVSYTAWVVSKGGTVGLRSRASGANSVVIAKYAPGTRVTVLNEGTEFHYVSIDGREGYMRSKYLSTTAPEGADPEPAKSSGFEPYTTTSRLTSSGGKAPVYKGEGLGWSVEAYLEDGTTVEVIAPGKDPYWVKVSVNGRKGYMQKKNLR